MFKSVPSMNKEDRRRGRPAGKNRIPLSLEERRARNAQYERERRNETAEAMAQLAEAAGCDPQISNADLLATVVSRLQRASKKSKNNDLEDIKRINNNLESQIAILLSRLGDDVQDLNLSESEHEEQKSSDAAEEIKPKRYKKYSKKSKTNTVHDRIHSESQSSDATSDYSTDRKRKGRRIGHKGKFLETGEATNAPASQESTSSVIESESGTSFMEPLPNDNENNIENLIDAVVQDVHFDDIFPQEQEANGVDMNVDLTPDNLTDIEKALLSDWLNCEQLGDNELALNQEQSSNWPLDFNDFISGF